MFIKNTLKSFLIASLLVSSIAVAPKAEARGSQWSTGATVLTTAAVIFAGLSIVASWVGAKCYFANQNGERQLKLLKEYSGSQVNIYPSVPTEIGTNPELQQQSINPTQQQPQQLIQQPKTPMTYEELSDEAREIYLKQFFSSTLSLKHKYPVAYIYRNIVENRKFRGINNVLLGNKAKKLDEELLEERKTLAKNKDLKKENDEYTQEYHRIKSLYHTSWDRILSGIVSGIGSLFTGLAHMKQAETNSDLAKKQEKNTAIY